MKKQRRHYAPEEKVAILRRHLLEKELISKPCDEVGLQPTVFYRWQKAGTPLSLDDARRLDGYVKYYNNVRLNSAIRYITPKHMIGRVFRVRKRCAVTQDRFASSKTPQYEHDLA